MTIIPSALLLLYLLIMGLSQCSSREQLTAEAGISIPSSFSSSAVQGKSQGFEQTHSLSESQLATDSSSALELGIAKA